MPGRGIEDTWKYIDRRNKGGMNIADAGLPREQPELGSVSVVSRLSQL